MLHDTTFHTKLLVREEFVDGPKEIALNMTKRPDIRSLPAGSRWNERWQLRQQFCPPVGHVATILNQRSLFTARSLAPLPSSFCGLVLVSETKRRRGIRVLTGVNYCLNNGCRLILQSDTATKTQRTTIGTVGSPTQMGVFERG